MSSLSADDVLALLTKKQSPTVEPKSKVNAYPAPPQFGPLRRFEKFLPCASTGYIDSFGAHIIVPGSKGCRAPTPFRLHGIPLCSVHCLQRMNNMLIERGVNE